MNEQYLDIDGRPQFTAGRAGEQPYAPDIPTPYNPNAPTQAPEMSLRERLMRALFMGGATDVRNMAQAAAPAGFNMALARMANPTAQLVQRAGSDVAGQAAEQMFDFSRPAPVMAAGGGMLMAAGGANAMGNAPPTEPSSGRLEFTPMGQQATQEYLARMEAQRRAQIEAAQRAAAERVNRGIQNWIPASQPGR